jgi:hypothetical protein
MAWRQARTPPSGREFDEARSFIMHGTEPSNDIVRVIRRPILAKELFSGLKITDGHLDNPERKP